MVAAATIAVAAGLTAGHREVGGPLVVTPTPVEAGGAHDVDVVFAIDTTGSMGGLIDSAKRTVWSIATHVKEIDPQANVRIGIVAYRDLGDEYVTKDFPLSNDLDAMYANLASLRAEGGGDIPEDVDAGLYAAVHQMPWRANAKKMIFVVGDAPPATRGDVPAYQISAREAASQGIVVNTIRAGWDNETQQTFVAMAEAGHGSFSTIQQDGGVQQVATPYDTKMAELSKTIDSTAIIVGDEGARDTYARNVAVNAAAGSAAAADRAAFYGGEAARNKADLVGNGADLDKVAPSALPAPMRGMTKGELEAEVAKRAATRQEAQKQILELSKQRAEYLKSHATAGDTAFDAKVKQSVEKSLAK